jgi:hypothetical protein
MRYERYVNCDFELAITFVALVTMCVISMI